MARNRQRAKARKQKLHRENIPGSLDHASGEVEEVEAAIVAGADGEPVEPDDAIEPDDAAGPVDAVEPDGAVEPGDVADPDAAPEPEAVEPDEVIEPADEPTPTPKPKGRRGRKPAAAVAPVEPVAEPEPEPALDDDEFDDDAFVDDDARHSSEGQRDATAEAVEDERLGKGAGDVAVTPNAGKPSGIRVFNFIRACWAELQRVDWPDRRQVGQATAVVLGFVVVAGAFLGLADVVAQKIVDLII